MCQLSLLSNASIVETMDIFHWWSNIVATGSKHLTHLFYFFNYSKEGMSQLYKSVAAS